MREKKRHDPFAPPYVPGLFLGEVRDEFEGHEYVVLVSHPSRFRLPFLVSPGVRWQSGG